MDFGLSTSSFTSLLSLFLSVCSHLPFPSVASSLSQAVDLISHLKIFLFLVLFAPLLQLTHPFPFLNWSERLKSLIYPVLFLLIIYLMAPLHSSSFSWIPVSQRAGSLSSHTWPYLSIRLSRAKAKRFPLSPFPWTLNSGVRIQRKFLLNQVSTSSLFIFHSLLANAQTFKPFSKILSNISYTWAHKSPNKTNNLPSWDPNKDASKGANTTKLGSAKLS